LKWIFTGKWAGFSWGIELFKNGFYPLDHSKPTLQVFSKKVGTGVATPKSHTGYGWHRSCYKENKNRLIFFSTFSMGLIIFLHTKCRRFSRQPRGQGGGACPDLILQKNPLENFNIFFPAVSSLKIWIETKKSARVFTP
jgi:hypothetical protein